MSDTLNYRVSGRADGPPLALIHGFMSCNAQWLANEAALGAAYRLVMIELWGHGDSPAPTDPAPYSVDRYVAEFEAIRVREGVGRWAAVVGQSYGAGLMLSYAQQHPQLCTAAVTMNSRSAFGTVMGESRPSDKPNPLDDPDFPLRKLPYHPANARRFPEYVKAPMVAKADAMQPHVVKLGGLLGNTLCFRDRMDNVPVPVMIANGVYEKSFQQDIAHLESNFANLHVVPMAGGHSVNVEAADEFNAGVLDFLARVSEFRAPVRIG